MPYSMDFAMQTVETIGKKRNPRFVIDNENRFVYENLIRWVHGDPEMKCIDPDTLKIIPGRLDAGIYIGGKTGTGKSWALDIMAGYCFGDDVRFRVGDKTPFLSWKNYRADTICEEYTATGSINGYKNQAIVCFHDLGSEPEESLYMGNRVGVMKQILECRGDRTDMITLITSNLPMCRLPESKKKDFNIRDLTDRYGDRVMSRLRAMCNNFEMNGKDRRIIEN
jgi:DNA replication protein DnaC